MAGESMLSGSSRSCLYRLAVVASHPVQYQAPLFQKLAASPRIDLTVFYGSDVSVRGEIDPQFGVVVKWDRPLLEGYRYKFLKNYAPYPSRGGFAGSINIGVIRELLNGRYDAVFIHSYATATSLLAYLGAWASRTPVLLRTESHLLEEAAKSRVKTVVKYVVLRSLFRLTDAFLTIGQENKRFYEHYGVSGDDCFLTPYSVDNEFFLAQSALFKPQAAKIRSDLGIPDHATCILHVGKLYPDKRVDDLLRACARLSRDYCVALIIVGDGSARRSLEKLVASEGLDHVRFMGFLNQTELSRAYVLADVFVLPSAHETWGLVLNEAMLHGLPIICTDHVGAAYDLVRHSENGFIYPVGDVEALTMRLRELLENPVQRKVMGQMSEHIIREWNHEVCVVGVLDALDKVSHPE